MIKNLPANARDMGLIPGQEDPLEEEMATHSTILAWKISQTEETGGLQSTGSQRVGHYSPHMHALGQPLSFEIERNGNWVVIAAASVLFHQLKSLEFEGELTILNHKQKGFSGDKKYRIQFKLCCLNIYKI